jgi:hypothetical protein
LPGKHFLTQLKAYNKAMSNFRQQPDSSEYAPFFADYVSLVSDPDILTALREQTTEVKALLGKLPSDKAGFRYAPEKWSIREVLGHLNDAERVFGFRAFTFARADHAELHSFDENSYVAQAGSDELALSDLLSEFEALRSANLFLLQGLSEAAWTRSGVVSGNAVSVRALAYIMAGHVLHHLKVLRERYLA